GPPRIRDAPIEKRRASPRRPRAPDHARASGPWARRKAPPMNHDNVQALARMNSLAKEILADPGYLKLPNLRPRDAAALILIDRSGPITKVLFGRRHHGHKFMPGKFVFPGGRVEPADRRMETARSLDRHVERQLMRDVGAPSSARA